MARIPKPKTEKKVTRYTYDEIKEPRTPETGHTSLLPADDSGYGFDNMMTNGFATIVFSPSGVSSPVSWSIANWVIESSS